MRPVDEVGAAENGGSARLRRARVAVAVVFGVHGTVTGNFATRIPWLRDQLGLSSGWLGLALVFATIGAALAMPFSAPLTRRFGPRAALRGLVVCGCAGLTLPALAPHLVWLCLALLLYGSGLGICDVAMNAQGVEVERRYGRSVMSGLHGMWSVGTLLGGGVGVLATHGEVDARIHLTVAAVVLALVGFVAARWTLDMRPEPTTAGAPGEPDPHGPDAPAPPGEQGRSAPRADTDARADSDATGARGLRRFAPPSTRVLAVGLIGFCAVFAEGASMDWSAVYLRDETEAAPWLAAVAYTALACAMAVSRLTGDTVVRRFGPVATVRTGGFLSALGGVLVVLANTPAMGVAGFALIGVGIAVVVPLCFAAAGRTTDAAPDQAIAGVATLAYASGLAAPAAVGWIAEAASLQVSFGLVTVLTLGLLLGAGVLRTEAVSGRSGPDTAPAAKPRPVSREP